VHTYLAIWVRDYVNRKLSEIRGYRAHVAAVTLHLWRGAYQIHDIDIQKTSGEVPVPFFSAPLVDLSVQWRALIFERAFVGNIELYRAEMNLVNGPSEESRQAPVDEPWAQKRSIMARFITEILAENRRWISRSTACRWWRPT
jgi:hypothetical protein